MAKRIFITQVNNYFGSMLADHFLQKGDEVVGFVDIDSESTPIFDHFNISGRCSLVYGDLADKVQIKDLLAGSMADLVVHQPAIGSLASSRVDAEKAMTTSTNSTLAILESLKTTASIRAVLLVSSDKVYRNSESSGSSGDEYLSEFSVVEPSDYTTTARLLAENILETYRKNEFPTKKFHLHKIRLATVRLGGALGPGDLNADSLVHKLCRSLLFGETISIKNPNSLRQWTSIVDQINGVDLLVNAMLAGDKISSVYNLSADNNMTVLELLKLLEVVTGKNANYSTGEKLLASLSRHKKINSQLACQQLGWTPENTLEKALLEAFNWYKEFYSAQNSATL